VIWLVTLLVIERLDMRFSLSFSFLFCWEGFE